MRYWYRIDIAEGNDTRVLIGSSELDHTALLARLEQGGYITLHDLSYRDDQNRIVSWTVWDPRFLPIVHINPRYVTTVFPFVADPRETLPTPQ